MLLLEGFFFLKKKEFFLLLKLKNTIFVDFCHICYLGVLGGMEDTPMEGADDLPTLLRIFKYDPKSKSSNNSLQQFDFHPNSIKNMLPAKAPPSRGTWYQLPGRWHMNIASARLNTWSVKRANSGR